MSSFEETIEQACATGVIPGAVVIASNADGSFHYENVFGKRSLREGADQSPLKKDAIMWIASCTKLLGTIAALQCVERGQLSLDAPVYDVLPEFKDQDILTGFGDDGKPQYKKHTTPMTLRHLLTHSSGLSYDMMHPTLMAWRESRGEKPGSGATIGERMHIPLLFEPGSSWIYGCGIDWAGKMVERVNNNTPLEAYMQQHIFGPLGIKDMTFDLSTRPDLAARMADMTKRDAETGGLKPFSGKMSYGSAAEAMAGQGLFSSAPEYILILRSLLANDSKLLQPDTVTSMFKPNLSATAKTDLIALVDSSDYINNAMGGLPHGTERDWGLGGLLNVEDVPDWRYAASLSWGGLPNLTWWIDRKADLCGMFAGQLMPEGDAKAQALSQAFEREMYRRVAAAAQTEAPRL
ncbi:beta-lactamase/transpeptidase-like protein [Phyllosticta citriasiana]|uniref:Beta-lactamase/transpeptidase-like protein n=1 Tax=Phyllosticta citriasiana TaxID=595635 RepID=A0ABR1L175_9PEZI